MSSDVNRAVLPAPTHQCIGIGAVPPQISVQPSSHPLHLSVHSAPIPHPLQSTGQAVAFQRNHRPVTGPHTQDSHPSQPAPTRSHGLKPMHLQTEVSDWDGWLDGNSVRNFTADEVVATKNLQVHRSTMTQGYPGGSPTSENWQGGKTS